MCYQRVCSIVMCICRRKVDDEIEHHIRKGTIVSRTSVGRFRYRSRFDWRRLQVCCSVYFFFFNTQVAFHTSTRIGILLFVS